MSKSLRELRASEHVGRPTRTHPVCIARKLTARHEALSAEHDELLAEQDDVTAAGVNEDGERPSNTRVSDGPDPRLAEIEKRLAEIETERDALAEQMTDHTGDVTLEAIKPGAWKAWKAAHPPREQGEAGWQQDAVYADSTCNIDDLIDDLGLWAKSWNGEPFEDGEWQFVADNAPGGSLRRLAHLVLQMHEGDDTGVSVPKSRRGSPVTQTGDDD